MNVRILRGKSRGYDSVNVLSNRHEEIIRTDTENEELIQKKKN
jgi:hypothetical protein